MKNKKAFAAIAFLFAGFNAGMFYVVYDLATFVQVPIPSWYYLSIIFSVVSSYIGYKLLEGI